MNNPRELAVPEEGQAAPQDNSFAEILSQFENEHHADRRAESLQGTVVSITPESVFVDLGRKMDGVLTIDQVKDDRGEVAVKIGQTIPVTITGRDEEGTYLLSTIKVERPKDWSALQRAFDEKRTIGGVVTELVKGGLRVDVGEKAFMPASRSGAREQADLEKLVGQEIQCRVIKLDIEDEDIVVDRRVVLEEEAVRAKEKAFSDLKEGAVVRGTVRSLTDFGAFVDLGGVDGLLHVGEMAWHRVAKPSDVVASGDNIEVKIIKVNPDTRRISLSLKALQPDPWSVAVERFHTGDRVQGKVTRLMDFGAFVELLPGVEGLIHISELSWSKKIKRPSDVVKAGEMVEAVVLGVNASDKRISLGLKQALGDPWEDAEKKYIVGTVVEAPVSSMTSFGAFVDLGNGIDGLIHISDITSEKRLNHPSEVLAMGKPVKAVVTEIDRGKRRIKLSIKQLEPTSIDEYIADHKPGQVVAGRVVDVTSGRVKVELGEGVFAESPLREVAQPEAATSEPAKGDISSLTAMLSAKWKQGGGAEKGSGAETTRAGQIRNFRIVNIDAAKKRIELEMA
ncbi:MAG TPA: 30S ribosomal protein S1 [Bryobacteraceae bacterium]|nr:30S ribosomal protein S1 [Bryobacteraceae bacterium]